MFKARSWEHDQWIAENSNYKEQGEKLTRTTSRPEVKFPCRATTWCTNRFFFRQQCKIPRQKAALDEERTQQQKMPAWDESEVTTKAEVIRRAKLEGKAVHFATFMDLCRLNCVISRTLNWRKKFQNYKGRVELRGWYRDGRFRELRRIHGAMCFGVTQDGGKSFGRDFKITRLFWPSKWCRERMHASQNERRTSIFIFRKNIFQRFGSYYRAHEDPKYWESIDDPVLLLERNLHVIHWLDSHGRKSPDGSACTFIAKKKNRNSWQWVLTTWDGKNLPKICATAKETDLEDPVSFTDQVYLGCTQRAAQVNNRTVMENQKLFSKLISTSTDVKTEEKNPKDITAWSQHMEGHGQKVCWMLLRSGAQDDWPRLAWTITKKNTKIWKLLEKCQRFVPRVYWNACIWQELEDQIYRGQLITWPDQSRNRACDLRPVRLITRLTTNCTVTLEIK